MTASSADLATPATISTHTLTWSVTTVDFFLVRLDFDFNSHAHVERDSWRSSSRSCQIIISTHTLTWSVTCKVLDVELRSAISTHTLTWSVTLDVVYIWCLLHMMRTYFLFIGDRFDFIHCMFTKSMAFSCELTRDL